MLTRHLNHRLRPVRPGLAGLCLLLAALVLSGCETVPPAPERPRACQEAPESVACACAEDPAAAACICATDSGLDCLCARTPDSNLCGACPAGSATALTRSARRDIGQGRWLQAERSVQCALEVRPEDPKAQMVKAQLDRRNSGYRGNLDARVTVPYTVLRGDRLGDIAQKCLGDPDRFVEIAVLNSIENPGRLRAGTQLRIPTVKPCVDCEELRDEALRSEAQGSLDDAVRKISDASALCRGDELINDDRIRLVELLTATLHKQAEAELANGETDSARRKWQRVLQLDPSHAKARFYLDQLEEGE